MEMTVLLNLKIKMPKRKSRCEMELLNTLLVLHRVEEELEHHHLDVLEVHPRGCHLVLVMSQALVSGYNPLSLSTGWPNWHCFVSQFHSYWHRHFPLSHIPVFVTISKIAIFNPE